MEIQNADIRKKTRQFFDAFEKATCNIEKVRVNLDRPIKVSGILFDVFLETGTNEVIIGEDSYNSKYHFSEVMNMQNLSNIIKSLPDGLKKLNVEMENLKIRNTEIKALLDKLL